LILAIGQHVAVGSLSDGPQVRRHFILPLTKIQLDNSSSVDGVPFVRIHHNTEETRVGVDEFGNETNFQVPEDRGVIQESQVCHVFTLLKLGRVDLPNLRGLESFFLECVKIRNKLCMLCYMILVTLNQSVEHKTFEQFFFDFFYSQNIFQFSKIR
jgi:hypothetical protein